jgi:malonyl CoA-acyl carrier protein transacylase
VLPGIVPGQMAIWASPKDHETIKGLVEQILAGGLVSQSQTFDLSDLSPGAFGQAIGQIQAALQYRVQVFQGVAPGQLVVWGKPADLERVETLVKQMLNDRSDATAEMKVYTVQRGNARAVVDQLILQIAPNARSYAGTSINQIVVWAKAADHLKIDEAIGRLNESDPNVSLKIYRTGTQKAATAHSLLQQRFPGLIVFPTTPNELVAWATSAEHETITQLLATVAEAFPNPVLKPYYFKYVPLDEAWVILYHAFSGAVVTMTPRATTQDLLIFATPEVHEQIAASIANFDVQRPEGTEALPKTYDLSDLSATEFWQAASNIPAALAYRVRVMPGVTPGQLVVWGKPADHEKVDMMVNQILAERPETTATMEVYALRRGTVENVGSLLMSVFPNIRSPRQGTSPNQMLVWAKASDHRKIGDFIDRLNESDPDMNVETYSLKNVDWYSAANILSIMITREGLDIQLYPDNAYSKRLVVLAKPEEQQRVADVLESFRLEDRTVESYHLEYTDPYSVQSAIRVLFFDEPYATKPLSDVEPNTNMIFVDGTKEQLAKVRKLLRDMGENIKESIHPSEERQNVPVPVQPPGNVRVLQIRSGETTELLRELEKQWKQSQQPNQLRIIKTEEITPPQFSMEDEIRRENPQTNSQAEEDGKTTTSLMDLLPSIPPVYVVASENGVLTVTSADTAALDQLEVLLKRINSRIVIEGQDYTIYTVRNISANVVYQRLQIALQNKILRGQMQQSGAANTIRIPLQITVDIVANTIMVRGSRVDRQEVAKLIALFDVSELPGERIVQKPITVPIENTEANRVFNEVQKVYGVKMMMTQLPGGVQPRIVVNSTTNSLEVFAPEPLATELAEYIKEVDNKAQEEPGRKLHVIQTGVKASVIQQAILQMQQQMRMQMMPYGIQAYPYPMSPYRYPGGVRQGF